jgi:hypothetical protein
MPIHSRYDWCHPNGVPMSRTELAICSALFLAIMLTIKYLIAPAIVITGGPIAGFAVIGALIALAYWIDAREKNKGR